MEDSISARKCFRVNTPLYCQLATFPKDQIKVLGRLTTNGMTWSNKTIKKAFKICFAASPTGYKTLQELQIPLPGIRTLQRRMQGVKYEPGMLTGLWFTENEGRWIDGAWKGLCVDLRLNGNNTKCGVAHAYWQTVWWCDCMVRSHRSSNTCLCDLRIAGNTTCWKQVVAYHYSGCSTNTKKINYWNNTKGSIHRATCGNRLESTTIKHQCHARHYQTGSCISCLMFHIW